MEINWAKEVEIRRIELIRETQSFLHIRSILDENHSSAEAPLGEGVKEALSYMLSLAEKDGFTAKNVGNLAGHIEFGNGEELIGILCHVDVVPEGDGWSSNPFAAEIRDGKIYARGALDDKGPTMAAYYAMKIVKELGLPLKRRVRMILGTDEESDWRCVDYYFKQEEMPTMGFAPDADFPIINAEKGIADFDLFQSNNLYDIEDFQVEVRSFRAGQRYNMVPDYATVTLEVQREQTGIVQRYQNYLIENKLKGKYHVSNGDLILELEGISAHGMEPNNGINAGLYLAKFLSKLRLAPTAAVFFRFVVQYFANDSRGEALGIQNSDDYSGDLTINVGKLSFTPLDGGKIGVNLRYPVSLNVEDIKCKLEDILKKEEFTLGNFNNSNPHYVSEDNFLIKTLKKVYEEQTGEKAKLLAIGGGTYARSLKSGVAFGPLFPGREDIAHQKDEYIIIDDLIKATAIYAQAIYELAQAEN